MNILILKFSIALSILSLSFDACSSGYSSEEEDMMLSEGVQAFYEGNFPLAFEKLQENPDGFSRGLCGNICLKELDGEPHSLKEAALYYVIAARKGDSDKVGYLTEIMGDAKINTKEAGEILVFHWVVKEQLDLSKSLQLDTIAMYFAAVREDTVLRIHCHKYPYFFHKICASFAYPHEYPLLLGSEVPQRNIAKHRDQNPVLVPPVLVRVLRQAHVEKKAVVFGIL